MTVKMIQNLGNRMEKIQETFNKDLEELKSKQTVMNNTITEIKNTPEGASLVAQWLGIGLPMQGTRVWALVQEDPTYRGAAKPMHHNYWACPLEPVGHNYWAHVPQLLRLTLLEPVLRNKRSHHKEKPAHHNEVPTQPKINK